MDLVSELEVSPQYLRDAIEIEMQKNDDPKQAALIAIQKIKSNKSYYQDQYGLVDFSDMTKAGNERSNHKYLFRKPDGKGGWNYIYREDTNKKKKLIEENNKEKNKNNNTVKLSYETKNGLLKLITVSARNNNKIQITTIDSDTLDPIGHREYNSLSEALYESFISENNTGIFNDDVHALKHYASRRDKQMEYMVNFIDPYLKKNEISRKEYPYIYIQPYRPVSSDNRGHKYGKAFNIDNDTKGAILTKEPISLKDQDRMEIYPLMSNALKATIEDYVKTFYPMQKATQLQIGSKLESEHKETFQFIKQYLKDHGKLPPEKEVYKHIAENHLDEFKNYYTKLIEMEKRMKKEDMKKAFFRMLKGEHKGPHKYYKKIPKPTGKGFLYFYTKDQYENYANKEKGNEAEEHTTFNVLSIIKNLFGLQTESEAKNKIKEDYKSKEIEKKYNISLQDYANHIREYFMNKDIWTAFVDQSKLPGDAQKSKISIPVKIGIIKELHGEYKNLSPVEKQEIQKSKFHVRLTSSNGQTKIKDFDTLDEAQQWADNKVKQLQQNIKDRKAHVISDVTLFNDEVSSSDGIKLFDIDEYVTKENNFDTMPKSEPAKETIQQKFERWKSGDFDGLLGTVFTLIQELTDLKTSMMHVDKVVIDKVGDFISYKFEGQPSYAGGGSINKNSFMKMLTNGTAIPAEMEKTIESGNGSKIESGKKPSKEEKKQIADEIQETAREGYYNEKPSEILNVGKDVWGARRHNFDTYERTNVDLQQLEKDGTALAYVTKKNLLGDYGLANKDERVKNGETEYKVLASYAIKEYLEKIPSNNELSRQKYADFCRAIIRLDQDTTTAKDFCYGLSEIFTTLFGSEKKQTNPDGSIDVLNLVKPSDYKIIKETIGGPLTVFMKSLSGNASTYDIYDLDGKREQKQFDVLSRIILAESKKGNDDYNSIYTKIFGKTKVSGIQVKKGDAIELTDELKNKIRLVKKSFSSDEQKQIYLAISKKMQNLYEYDIKFDYFENPGNKEILEKEFGQKFNSKEEAKNYFNSEMKSLKEELSKHIVIDYIYPTSAGQVVRAGRNTIDVAFTFPDGQVRAWEMRPEDIKPENIQSAEKQSKEKSNYKFDLYFESQAERKGGKNYDSINAKEAQKILEDKYMFKAVQYGNSMPDTERIYHTKKSLEAFSDLSEILNIPIQQVTVNGKLGIAFGARGHDPFGRSGGVAAHYERGSKMINLTRSNGFGSLAHEWGHFLDNILTNDMQHYMSTHPDYIDKKVSSKNEIKHGSIYERVARKKVVRYFFDANAPNARYPFVQLEEGQIEPGKDAKRIGLYSYNITVQEPVESSRMKQLAQDIANVSRESLREQTKQAMENFQPGSLQYEIYKALILDNDYLNRKNECFARAFEAYIGDKLENNGRKNTYLSSQKKTLEKDGGTIYPQKEYRKTINDLFEQFFNEVRNSGELKKAIDLLEKNQMIKWFNPDTHQFEYIRKK